MSAFLAEHSYDIPVEDEPSNSFLDVLDPRSAWVGDSNRTHGSKPSVDDRKYRRHKRRKVAA